MIKSSDISFYPSIYGISFYNYQLINATDFTKHIKGDIYYQGKCIGYYDPLYHEGDTIQTKPFIRIESEEVESLFKDYYSIFASNIMTGDLKRGFPELMKDLEYLTYLYTFMHNVQPNDRFEDIRLIGIINNEFIQAFQLKDNTIVSDRDIIHFFKDKIEQYVTGKLNDCYPIKLFQKLEDFKIDIIKAVF
jgi:hypothetical protein